MGDSYDTRTNMPKGISCLVNYYEPNNVRISEPKGEMRMSSLTSSEEISNMMGISLSGKGGWGPFSASISAKYAQSATDTSHDMHFNYYQTATADISYNIKNKGNNILDQDSRDILEKGEGMDGFSTICGDSFIQSANVGAALFVDIVIHFDSQEHKKSFEASIQGKAMSIASVAAEFKVASNSYASHSSISVAAMQSGGDAQKLADLFGPKKPGENFPIVDCAGGEIDKCTDVLNGVIEYAQNDFAKGIDFKNPDNLYIYNYREMKFSDLGVKAKFNDISEEAQKASLLLIDSIKQDRMMLEYLKKYQSQQDLMNSLPQSNITDLNNAIKKYESIVKEYDNQNIMGACYGTDADHLCVAAWKHINEVTHPYYAKTLNFAADVSDTIIVQSPESRKYYYALVPLIGHCNQLGECSGLYGIYEQKYVTLTNPPPNSKVVVDDKGNPVKVRTVDYTKTVCHVDTTANNSYFKNSFPEYVGKNIVCETVPDNVEETPVKTMYVKRIEGDLKHSIFGDYVNGVEKDRPINANKSNVELKYYGQYSDSDWLSFNPI
jgi:hypothetical protein